MKKNNRITQADISDAISHAVGVESERIADLQSDQISEVNGAAMPTIPTTSSVAASLLPDLKEITTAGMFPKMEISEF